MKPSILALAKRSVRRMELKDYISIIFSFSALLVSLISVYITQFRHVDDLRVAFMDPFGVKSNFTLSAVTLKGDFHIAFVNDGNRSIAVSDMRIRIVENAENYDCDSGSSQFVFYELDPFVIKAGEVLVKTASIREDQQTHERKSEIRYLGTTSATMTKLTVCFVVNLTTPNSFLRSKTVAVWRLAKTDKNDGVEEYYPLPLREGEETIVLLP